MINPGRNPLPWLLMAPTTFRQELRSLEKEHFESPEQAQRVASYCLDINQLHSLGRAIPKIIDGHQIHAVKLGVLSNGTVDLIVPAIVASALRHGVWLQTVTTPFNQTGQEAFNSSSDLNRAGCDFILLAIDHRGLSVFPVPGNAERANELVDEALQYIDSLRSALRNASGCSVIVQTIPQVASSLFGSLDRTVPGTMQWMIDRFNGQLRARIAGSSDLLLDVAALAEMIGLSSWHDPTQWAIGKFPCAHDAVPLYADWVGRLVAAARGKSRKCLVLDLDNTIWGGVVGDDGPEGILLGNGNPAGEAFLSVQQAALALRERGVILAVSSKNDDSVARTMFRNHPEMILKEDHIAVFQANWQDKASNIKAIAEKLNLGTDSMVLLDDNPAERSQVRQALPDVAVPELPDDPALFAETLLRAGYFESIRFTAEDRLRADQYQANAARAELLSGATDLQSYLQSLEMKAVIGPFDVVSRGRITQLINKTNQFNLTTHRYTESQVAALEDSVDGLTLQIRLIDKFGDNGIVVIVICNCDGPDWLIDTWLMSCRVLNRKLEEATLNSIMSAAKIARVRTLIGQYFPSGRNEMVKEHYSRLGFMNLDDNHNGSRWQLDVKTYVPIPVPITINNTACSIGGGRTVTNSAEDISRFL
jgi:FkbH-like protein